MTEFFEFAILGLATGSLYGLVALGVVLVYRSSGILNFASGATGAAGAYLFYNLRDHHMPVVAALPLGLLLGAVVGFISYLLVMRLLEKSSRLAKLVATLGILSTIEGIISIVSGGTGFNLVSGFLPFTAVHLIGGLAIGENRLIIMGIVVVLATILWYVYKYTLFGLATSAVAENRRAAAALGRSPARVECINFIIAGVLSALAAILLAPIVGLDVSTLSILIVPAFAAAAVGRFSSFGLTLAGAGLIGIVEAWMVLYVQTPGWGQAIPFFVIVIVIVAGGRARQSRGDLSSRLPMPGAGRRSPSLIVLAAVVTGVAVLLLSASWAEAITASLLLAIIGLSIVVITGFTGQLSLAQFAIAGIGAWIAGRLVAAAGIPFWLGVVIGVALAVPAGMLIALPALRTRGVNLAVVTLGLSLAVEGLIFNNPALTGGFVGTVVGSPRIFGINLDPVTYPGRYAVLVIVCLAGAGLVVTNVRRGRSGRRMLAVRSNERAAASLGVGVYGVKMYAFGLAASIASLGGILTAFQNPDIVLSNFTSFASMGAVQTGTIGGIGWASGSLVAGLFGDGGILNQVITSVIGDLHSWIPVIPQVSSGTVEEYLPILAGLGVVQVLRAAPNGLASLFSAQFRRWVPGKAVVQSGPIETEPSAEKKLPTNLSVNDLSVHFGGVKALDGVNVTVGPGQVLGIIGPNGAGKTTLLDAVSGFVKPAKGTVTFYEQDIGRWTPEKRARAGLVRSFQAVELFDELTIRENLLVASDPQSPLRYVTDLVRPGVQPQTLLMTQTIDDFGLGDVLDRHPPELSHGTARIAGIARAMATGPSILLLDEPASGLDTHERQELKTLISSVAREHGVGVVLIEHDVGFVLDLCDKVLVLNFGRAIALGTPDEIRKDPEVIAAYLGEPENERERAADQAAIAEISKEPTS
jgi:ABC-type branched-subunit amino acid transport system ATPase component/branched-subunit amino acid ABC-type transport system permease component